MILVTYVLLMIELSWKESQKLSNFACFCYFQRRIQWYVINADFQVIAL
jgi:hypothetical protein